MVQIIDSRGTGKSTTLLFLAKETNAIVICRNPVHMRELAYTHGIEGLEYKSYIEVFNGCLKGKREPKIVIDDLDAFIETYFNYNVKLVGYTLTKD